MRIGDVMERDLTAVTLDATVGEVIEILARHRLSGIPVVDEEGHVKGYIGEQDIVKAALPGYFEYLKDASFIPDFGQFQTRLRRVSREPVTKYMVTNITCFHEDDTDFTAAMSLIRYSYRRGPVVRDNVLVGVVDRADLLKHLLCVEED